MHRIYLDNAATTKINKRALEEYVRCSEKCFANPSALHRDAQEAQTAVENARDTLAELLFCRADEIIFTSGATEADNMALAGFASANKEKGRHIITCAAEHPAVLNTCKYLEQNGFDVTYLPVNECGQLSFSELENAVREDTILISLMYVNNENGIINPIDGIAELAEKHNIPFHTDAVQAFTKLPIYPAQQNITLLSASAHKFGGPKGTGFLYVKKNTRISSVLHGGAQEEGLRPGTINAPAIAAMAVAAKEAFLIQNKRKEYLEKLKDIFITSLTRKGEIRLNTQNAETIFDIMSFSFPSVMPDKLLYALDMNGLSVSAGSACSAGTLEISHVIRAMGCDKYGSPIRISPGLDTTVEEAEKAVETILRVYESLKK